MSDERQAPPRLAGDAPAIQGLETPATECPARALARVLETMAIGRDVYAEHLKSRIQFTPGYMRQEVDGRSQAAASEAAVLHNAATELARLAVFDEAMGNRHAQFISNAH